MSTHDAVERPPHGVAVLGDVVAEEGGVAVGGHDGLGVAATVAVQKAVVGVHVQQEGELVLHRQELGLTAEHAGQLHLVGKRYRLI